MRTLLAPSLNDVNERLTTPQPTREAINAAQEESRLVYLESVARFWWEYWQNVAYWALAQDPPQRRDAEAAASNAGDCVRKVQAIQRILADLRAARNPYRQ